MKKTIIWGLCGLILLSACGKVFAGSWDERKKQTQQLLKKSNLVTADRFELVYGQKITDRMSNHFAYILKDNETGVEYLIYTVGTGDSTAVENLGICPLQSHAIPAGAVPHMGGGMPPHPAGISQPEKMAPDHGNDPFADIDVPDEVTEPVPVEDPFANMEIPETMSEKPAENQ